MATKKNPWKTAREKSGKTLMDGAVAIRQLPERYWVSTSKLSRLETDQTVIIHPVALAALAALYGQDLRKIDPAAADELDSLPELVGSVRAKYAPRDSNPEPADIAHAA